ncbi:hypothetical protein PFICI_14413 [Pestalotiopsis fici W106-1]|uniref:SAP domain-containing protein n=1 Tax=Pestalotiopsis fici (strain W106-1 / CGMCC3.15140) TaxID=1229662 RepID=W3WJY8_PESFW|nr:uncharacterized protein PFICI_14413 [Pestalotiopsis fici W106-1]ETS73467.1 hypothetical protein PFICI_14413 [Pestalotiopsis fici W106-1]
MIIPHSPNGSSDGVYEEKNKTIDSRKQDTENAKPQSNKVPGNGNFSKATRNRVKGRNQLPKDELVEFDRIKISELKEELKKRGYKVGSMTKVQLWNRIKGREAEPGLNAKSVKTRQSKPATKKVPGNGNFARSSQKRAADRDTIPAHDLEEFDHTKVADLRKLLQSAGLSASGRKIDLWLRWKDADAPTTEDGSVTDEWDAQMESDEDRPWLKDLDESIHEKVTEARNVLLTKKEQEAKAQEQEDESLTEDDDKAKEPRRGKAVVKTKGKRFNSTQPQRTQKRSRVQSRDDREGGNASIKPTCFYIDKRFLDMSVAQISQAIPRIMDGAASPQDANISLRHYLVEHYNHRRGIAQLQADGNVFLGNLNESSIPHNVLRRGFAQESFVHVLDYTPEIFVLWEQEVDAGNNDLWRNRWNHPRLSGFTCSLLNGRSFIDAVKQYPKFGLLIMDGIMDGRLKIQGTKDMYELQEVLNAWVTELEMAL